MCLKGLHRVRIIRFYLIEGVARRVLGSPHGLPARDASFDALKLSLEDCSLRFFPLIVLISIATCAYAQQPSGPAALLTPMNAIVQVTNDSQGQSEKPQQPPSGNASPAASPSPTAANPPAAQTADQGGNPAEEQPKRILGVMPNFRAVSAGAIPPPPTAKEALWVATQNTFDYSSFVFVGITSLLAEATDSHTQLGEGGAGFGRYYWRGFVDKADGNYLVIFALPTVLHEDERYYAMGHGNFWKRLLYSSTRTVITPNYQGHNTFNFAEIVGRGAAQGISVAYYPSDAQTVGALASKFAYAVGRDTLTNVFREFWPDIATHVLHRHP